MCWYSRTTRQSRARVTARAVNDDIIVRRTQENRAMARIPLLDETDPTTDARSRAALLEAAASRGKLINFYRALANRPQALRAMTTLLQTVYRKDSTLQPRHGELAYLTATTANNCFY
jgi:alkylhydroperoxidase family enzyme